MSSLLQHRGIIDKRGVELLMYLRTTEVYARCDHCGVRQDLENTACDGCKKPFALRFRGASTDGKYTSNMEVLIPYDQRTAPDSNWSEPSIGNTSHTFDTEPVEFAGRAGATCPKLYRIFRRPAGMFGCWVVFRWNGKTHVPDLSVPIAVDALPRDAKPLTDIEAETYWFGESS